MSASDLVMSGPLVVAALLAIAAGLVSFLSPCCLPLVPGYLSYVAGMSGAEHRQPTDGCVDESPNERPNATTTEARPSTQAPGTRRVVLGAFLFVAGFAAVFTSYGILFGTFGALLIAHQETLVRVLGALTIVFGLMFTSPRYSPWQRAAPAPVVALSCPSPTASDWGSRSSWQRSRSRGP